MKYLLPSSSRKRSVPLRLVTEKRLKTYLAAQMPPVKAWVKAHGFTAKAGTWLGIPEAGGGFSEILAGAEETPGIWGIAGLPAALPQGVYRLEVSGQGLPSEALTLLGIGWGLGCYSYQRFRTEAGNPHPPRFSRLILPEAADVEEISRVLAASFLARDLINAPANRLTPAELAETAVAVAKEYGAKAEVIVGEELLKANYPAVYEVGKASVNAPRLIDLRWGNAKHPKITLVGKGVCFDSGGLDIKSSSNMLLMKKDMGGAAVVLALAQMIMSAKLPVALHVLIPAVENSIGGNAFRPLDVISTRKGLTVEVGNTDAEGRLILCDALHEADSEQPELLIDCATLTGAARVALGTEVPAFFTPSDRLAGRLEEASRRQQEPLWRLPLHLPYDDQLKSAVADLSSTSSSAYGGAITAALFLRRFVPKTQDWVHVDLMAWNVSARPGRPVGGEAMGLRSLYALVKKYAENP